MKIQKTQEKIAALKIPKKRMLGSDYKKGDYFYFRATPGKIFRKDKQNKKWYILDNKNDLEELTNKLCEKGINEKKLKYYMKKILQEIQMQEEVKKESNINNEENKEKNKDEDMEENKDESKDENMEENKDEKGKEEIKQENKKEEIILSPLKSKVIPIIPTYPQDDPRNIKHTTNDILLEIERKFSDYLTQFNKEWESLENREKWKEIITHTNNENNFISTLRMFNHRFKKTDISDSKMNTIITMLSTYKGHYKLLTNNNLIVFITEYGIYMGFIIDEIGTVVGEENSDYWVVKSTGSDTRISNKMFLFNNIKKKINECLGNKEIKEYIIMGGNCIFLVKLSSAKILRMNNVFMTFTKTEMKKVYTEEEIDAMADSLNQIM